MNIFDMLKYAKVAWTEKAQIETLVAQAKVMEGPKPSWKTGEFWVFSVLPVVGGMIAVAATIFTAPVLVPWFVGATTIIALGSNWSRTWLKGTHVSAASFDLSNPLVMAQLTTIVKNVTDTVSAIKDAKAGNLETAKTLTETLNAPVTVNVEAK